jgi:hypothetical protein
MYRLPKQQQIIVNIQRRWQRYTFSICVMVHLAWLSHRRLASYNLFLIEFNALRYEVVLPFLALGNYINIVPKNLTSN